MLHDYGSEQNQLLQIVLSLLYSPLVLLLKGSVLRGPYFFANFYVELIRRVRVATIEALYIFTFSSPRKYSPRKNEQKAEIIFMFTPPNYQGISVTVLFLS